MHLTTSVLHPFCHSSAGHTLIKANFAGQTEKCPSAAEMLPYSTTEPVLYSPSATHEQQGKGEEAMERESTKKV